MLEYVDTGEERATFRRAYARRTPVLLLGPTGCGKTLLVECMAAELGRPLITVTCHDDLTTADLVGRHLIRGGDVEWQDGPLTTAVRTGAICYLDEIVEARADTLAMLHSVSDHRRSLYVDRLDKAIDADPDFLLVASYNPRAAGFPKELRPSLRQRFATVRLNYLPPESEARVVVAQTAVAPQVATRLAEVAVLIRDAAARERHAPFDPPSTRTLVAAAALVAEGAEFGDAVDACLIGPLTADASTATALRELVQAAVPPD